MGFVFELLHGIIYVRQVFFYANVVFICFEDAIIVAFKQNLAGLGSNRLKMSGGDALAGDILHLRGPKKKIEGFVKRRPWMCS
jgi:hypothetical protein